jgi:hypothetical protein
MFHEQRAGQLPEKSEEDSDTVNDDGSKTYTEEKQLLARPVTTGKHEIPRDKYWRDH